MKYLFFISFIFWSSFISGQVSSSLRGKLIPVNEDSVKIDSLSVQPYSLLIFDPEGRILPDSLYKVNYANGYLYPSALLKKQVGSFKIVYRTFPFLLSQSYFHKQYKKVDPQVRNERYETNSYIFDEPSQNEFFARDQLDKHGTISRGVSFGNNQDAVLNSALNLQLSGKLSDDLNLVAAISDENIPIQPDGNSQQLQEFDKVFIQISNQKFKLIAGDFEIQKPEGYFMNFHKKAKGGYFTQSLKSSQKEIRFSNTASLSVSKGKYNKMEFNGLEGNQGPYSLKGASNETYIIIIAGSERVYIDGLLLTRGAENDYVMDYNTGELRFTPKQLITKDKRIIVEFEYSDRYYNRFMVFGSTQITTPDNQFYIHIFSEQDARNQPIDQDLTPAQKDLLSDIGDSIQQAIIPNIRLDTVFSGNYVFYKRIDTILTNGVRYDSILVYSVNADSAIYRAGFSWVGSHKGFYILNQKANANGRVYTWVAPLNGELQGNYQPVTLLVTPKKKQMIVAGGRIKLGDKTEFNFESALTINDINTFSAKDKNDDAGYAIKASLEQDFLERTSKRVLNAGIEYQLVNHLFSGIEQFREVEFNRDWNQTGNQSANQHLLRANIMFRSPRFKNLNLKSEYLDEAQNKAFRNTFSTNYDYNRNTMNWITSYLNSKAKNYDSKFYRSQASFSRQFGNLIAGANDLYEDNQRLSKVRDSLITGSFRSHQWDLFLRSVDSSRVMVQTLYSNRINFKPDAGTFKNLDRGQSINLETGLVKNPEHTIKSTFSYRWLTTKVLTGSADSIGKTIHENTLIGRLEHFIEKEKGLLSFSTFYELGNSLEPKREFSYLQVNHGEGVYVWIDYNQNHVKELNEFEMATFADTANYIRMFLPTANYVKTYSTQFGEVFQLKPYAIWKGKQGIKGFVAHFSNMTAYRIDRKITSSNYGELLNPFSESLSTEELISVNTSLRNTFSWNKTSPRVGADYLFQLNKNKMLLLNGFDQRTAGSHALKARWNISSVLTFLPQLETGHKEYESQAFGDKNFKILNQLAKVSIQCIVTPSWKIGVDYQWQDKRNKNGIQKYREHTVGFETRYSIAVKGSISCQLNYVNITFNDKENSSVAYEMLSGFKKGSNGNCRIIAMYNISEILQLNLEYNARINEGSKVIHTGSVQLRAYF